MCKFCEKKEFLSEQNGGYDYVLIENNELKICYDYDGRGVYMEPVKIKFCPMCGRELV